MTNDQIKSIAARFLAGCSLGNIESLGSAGGFSGAQLWRLETELGPYCLRQWPRAHPDRERLKLIHSVLFHVRKDGVEIVPVPLLTTRGESFVLANNHFVELTPWMPGRADFWIEPTELKLKNAMQSLARFHLASRKMSSSSPIGSATVSPGIVSRIQQLRDWVERDASNLAKASGTPQWPELTPLAGQILHFFRKHALQILDELNSALKLHTLIQPSIRDIWHDHVLFEGDEVTGIVDFGALNWETPSADVARLLGSLVADSRDLWAFGEAAYRRINKLGENESRLISVFDRSNTLLAPMNWMRWIYLENRHFDDRSAVVARLRKCVERMENLICVAEGKKPIDY